MQPEITIYYTNICGLCTKAIEYLRSQNLAFQAKPVIWDQPSDAFADTPNAREMIKRCGETVDFVPQIFIGNTHIAGWRKLEPMIASGELDQLLSQ
ncbi:MAG: glutaredoxin domain-containing protein [Kiritimatiellia bacterium]